MQPYKTRKAICSVPFIRSSVIGGKELIAYNDGGVLYVEIDTLSIERNPNGGEVVHFGFSPTSTVIQELKSQTAQKRGDFYVKIEDIKSLRDALNKFIKDGE